MRYRTIVADPPWEKPDTGARTHSSSGGWDTGPRPMTGRACVTPYPQMSLEDIEALPIRDLAEDDAHLYVWTFGPYIPETYRLVEAWGFKPSALVRLRRWDSTWFTFKRGAHSAKPECLLDIVEQISPELRLEMFARRQRLGWHVWGNEVDSHIEMPA